jgi:hypothetical protein
MKTKEVVEVTEKKHESVLLVYGVSDADKRMILTEAKRLRLKSMSAFMRTLYARYFEEKKKETAAHNQRAGLQPKEA